MYQPLRFKDPTHYGHVCLMHISFYGLKQAPRSWYTWFAEYVSSIGFIRSKYDNSLFIYQKDNHMTYLLLYAGDIILTTFTYNLRQSIISPLNSKFVINEFKQLSYFLGIAITRYGSGLFLLSQKIYR